jgi:S-(hydroxymethyl)glutathione dehydrogenase/alcohol dehydrogenase
MNTKAAILRKTSEPLEIRELLCSDLKPGQVLVKVAYSGICHSQLNEISGLRGEDKFCPHTLGHEGSGIVEKVGEGVKKVKAGDHVVLTWIKGSGMDVPSCRYIDDHGGVVNSGAISTFLTEAVISENRLVKIHNNMPLKEAALLGCAIPTGAGIIMKTVRKTDAVGSIAVFGLGGIGLSVLLMAEMMSIPQIIGIDISDYKLEKARQIGATNLINVKEENVLASIMKITSGKGVDYAVECSGNKTAMEIAFQAVRDKGGLCVIAGNLPQGEKISINPFDLIKGKRLMGTWGGETNPDEDIPLYVDLYLSGKLKIDKLISNMYSLQEINKALDEFKKGVNGRVLIDMSQHISKI